MPRLKQAEQLEEFLVKLEAKAIELANWEGVMVRLERDTRGRYPTFILRAVGIEPDPAKRVVLMRKYNGHKQGEFRGEQTTEEE